MRALLICFKSYLIPLSLSSFFSYPRIPIHSLKQYQPTIPTKHTYVEYRFGKPVYNPPEMYTNYNRPPGVDPVKVDVFQLGIALYMMVTAGETHRETHRETQRCLVLGC